MERMTDQEGRETIREIMEKWDAAVSVAIGLGQSQAQAEETAGRYFNRIFLGE